MAISDMGIAQIREGLASKQFTACEVAQASLDRIAQADSQVHAFLEVTSEAAMAAAQRVDQAIADGTFDALGPLAGVPGGVQGQHEHDGHAHHLLLPHAGKLRVPVHRNVRAAHHRRGRRARWAS